MGPIGVPEMIAIFVIALLLFGPKKLPELGKNVGKSNHRIPPCLERAKSDV